MEYNTDSITWQHNPDLFNFFNFPTFSHSHILTFSQSHIFTESYMIWNKPSCHSSIECCSQKVLIGIVKCDNIHQTQSNIVWWWQVGFGGWILDHSSQSPPPLTSIAEWMQWLPTHHPPSIDQYVRVNAEPLLRLNVQTCPSIAACTHPWLYLHVCTLEHSRSHT